MSSWNEIDPLMKLERIRVLPLSGEMQFIRCFLRKNHHFILA